MARAGCLADFRASLALPAIQELLRRPAGAVAVRREHRYVRLVAGGIEEGSIDRLVLHRSADGAFVAADVIDFKTGRTDDPAILAARHGGQLRTYRDVVVEQFGLAPAAIHLRIAATGTGVVVDVD